MATAHMTNRCRVNLRLCCRPTPHPTSLPMQCGLSSRILDVLKKGGFERPLSIQAQALPGELTQLLLWRQVPLWCWVVYLPRALLARDVCCCKRCLPAPLAPLVPQPHTLPIHYRDALSLHTHPAPSLSLSLPAVIMSGRDCIGIAKTGSGKTLAFVLPMLRHVKDQPPLVQGDGPVALCMAPTRELVNQVLLGVADYAAAMAGTCSGWHSICECATRPPRGACTLGPGPRWRSKLHRQQQPVPYSASPSSARRSARR